MTSGSPGRCDRKSWRRIMMFLIVGHVGISANSGPSQTKVLVARTME